MPQGKIIALYVSLIRQPYRFVVRRRMSTTHEIFDVYRPHSLGDFVSELLQIFADDSTDFLEKVSRIDDRDFMASKHKTRRYIAERKDLLYIDNPQLAERHARQHSGYWFITNIGTKEAHRFAQMISEASGTPCETISKKLSI